MTGEARDRGRAHPPDAAPPTGHGRSGRRRGKPDTRAAILEAARKAFAAGGFASVTIRKVAAAAGVDPALVHHYFGTKEKLFLETIEVPVDFQAAFQSISAGPVETLGHRLATVAMTVWDSPAGIGLIAAVRAAIDDPAMAQMVQEFLRGQVIGKVLRAAGCPAAEYNIRGALIASQMAGVLVGRHIFRLEPLSTLPIAELAPDLGATLQRYLTEPLAVRTADG